LGICEKGRAAWTTREAGDVRVGGTSRASVRVVASATMEIVSIVSPDREGAPARATVTVRGQATVRTEPDVAILWITLSAFEESPGKALGDVAQRAEALGALLDELGVREADRSTAGVSVAEEFDPPTRGNRGLGHRATARIAVHLADPEVIGRAISRASEDLRASIDGPHWFVTPANPARLEAARQAAADARSKAQAYAAGVGVTLDGLICLVEPDTAGRPPGIRRVSGAAGGRDMPIDVEEYEVRATIDATFALNVADDGRETQRQQSPATKAPRRKPSREHDSRS
jgi:uncharacterized protein